MSDKNLKARVKRLAEYLESISGDSPVEGVFDFSRDEALEGVTSRSLKKAADVAVRASRGGKVSAQDLYHAEAIVHRTKRPSHKIEDGKFSPFPGEFGYLTKRGSIRKGLASAFKSIGRIDIPERSTYGGTGFVVGHNLVMTNRHVAELFTSGVGKTNVTIRLKESEIDFNDEPSDIADGFPLTECVMIHPYWDMALFRADLPKAKSLSLAVTPYKELLKNKQDVAVIGYPARDPRNGVAAQREIFGSDFEVKRIAPGKVSKRKKPVGSKWLSKAVDAMAHDASSLGGNSGSPVFNVDTGEVVALHFAGRYLVENYAVPCHELARDACIVDSGVNFNEDDGLPSTTNTLDRYWRAAETESKLPASGPTVFDLNSSSTSGDTVNKSKRDKSSAPSLGSSGEVSIELPLRITISLGEPNSIPGGQGGSSNKSDHNLNADRTESVGQGYDADFLSETVPTPALSDGIADDAFEVDGSHLIPYTHFSVCQSKSRTLPRFVAWNIDGGNLISVDRGNNFRRDPRVPDEFQSDNALYRHNPYDRGHVARRADLNWGAQSEAERANSDSFFYTNIAPQHELFNQSRRHGLWGKLENAVLEDVDVENIKISVMGGPIFRDDDPEYRDVQIPRDFWKLLAYRDTADGEFKVAAYILSQREFVPTEVLELDMFRLYQASLGKLSEETSLNFDALTDFDTYTGDTETVSGAGVREIKGREDLFAN